MFNMGNKNKFNRLIAVLLHILFWALLLIMPLIVDRGEPKPPPNFQNQEHFNEDNFRLGIYLFQFLLIGYFYIVAYGLVPRFLNKRRSWLFVSLALGIGVFNLLITYVVRTTILLDPNAPMFMRIEITLSLITLLSGITFGLIKRSFSSEKKMNAIEAENLRTELLFLRSQISPHFLLNTLNNLVSLARKNSEKLEPMLLKLSGILKYMVYEAEDDKISLQDEINYLRNYISLQQMRFTNNSTINFTCAIKNEHQMIVPMLLIPFVENAFKHGVVGVQNPYIDINIKEENGELIFLVINKYDLHWHQVKDKTSGIGLTNVKRRLELLYPDKYLLDISESEDSLYSVYMKLELK